MPFATVYADPHCPDCRRVQEFFAARGVPYRSRDITRDQEALADVQG
jgi:glutaredoxin